MEKITLENVSKSFKEKTIFSNVNLTFEKGRIYGVCGYNGCGKTMLLRIISGLVKASSGSVLFDGVPFKQNDTANIGIVIDKAGFFEDLNAFDNLSLLADLRHKISKKEIEDVLHRVGLGDTGNTNVRKFSLGMKQRLAFAQAIMEDPEILLLDEPTNALDQNGIEMVHTALKELKEQGKIIILTSHNPYDLDAICDCLCKYEDGTIKCYEKV